MMLSKNAGSLPDERAQAMSTTATAAAARMTSAYSAVVCPTSRDRRTRRRTYQDSSTGSPPSSADGLQRGHEHRDHGEEEEGGEDEEHEREQHLHGRLAGALGEE